MEAYVDDFEDDVKDTKLSPTPLCENEKKIYLAGACPSETLPVFVTDSQVQTEPFEKNVEREYEVVVGGARYSSNPRYKHQINRMNSKTVKTVSRGTLETEHFFVQHELRKIEFLPKFYRLPKSHNSSRPSTSQSQLNVAQKKANIQPMSAFMSSKIGQQNEIEDTSEETLHGAACLGDVEKVLKIVESQCQITGADRVSIVNSPGYVFIKGSMFGIKKSGSTYTIGIGAKATPIQFAALLGQTAAVKCLLDLGALDNSAHTTSLPSASSLAKANGFDAMLSLFNLQKFRREAIKPSKGSKAKDNCYSVNLSAVSQPVQASFLDGVQAPPEFTFVQLDKRNSEEDKIEQLTQHDSPPVAVFPMDGLCSNQKELKIEQPPIQESAPDKKELSTSSSFESESESD